MLATIPPRETQHDTRSRVTLMLPAQMGGDEEDVPPELNIVLTAAAELHLLPPDGEHLLLHGGNWVLLKNFGRM